MDKAHWHETLDLPCSTWPRLPDVNDLLSITCSRSSSPSSVTTNARGLSALARRPWQFKRSLAWEDCGASIAIASRPCMERMNDQPIERPGVRSLSRLRTYVTLPACAFMSEEWTELERWRKRTGRSGAIQGSGLALDDAWIRIPIRVDSFFHSPDREESTSHTSTTMAAIVSLSLKSFHD